MYLRLASVVGLSLMLVGGGVKNVLAWELTGNLCAVAGVVCCGVVVSRKRLLTGANVNSEERPAAIKALGAAQGRS